MGKEKPHIMEWRFPFKGINKTTSYRDQPEGTSPDLANVRAWDILTDGEGNEEGRARGGQRGGYESVMSLTGEVYNAYSFRSRFVNGNAILCVHTSTGIYIGNDPTQLTLFDWANIGETIPEDTPLVGFRDKLFVPFQFSITDSGDPELPALTSAPGGANTISDWNDLYDIREKVDDNEDFELLNDLDENTAGYEIISDEDSWEPIGDQDKPFNGVFYGNGHTISGLKIEEPEMWEVGLFGHIDGGSVYDLNLDNVQITGQQKIGGVAGYADGCTIKNCHVTGNMTAHSVNPRSEVGGLIGYSKDCNIAECSADVDVVGALQRIGGLIGIAVGTGTIEHCKSEGDVRAGGEHHDTGSIGGLIGEATGNVSIENSYSTSLVMGNIPIVGGLIGFLSGDVVDSYYRGRILKGEETSVDFVGGLVGKMTEDGSVTESYWNVDKSGIGKSAGGIGLSYDKDVRIATYGAWTIEDIDTYDPTEAIKPDWFIEDGIYTPKLWWEERYPVPEDGELAGLIFDPQEERWGRWIAEEGHTPEDPVNATSATRRMIYTGIDDQPTNVYASRMNDPMDWDISRNDQGSAVLRNLEVNDEIVCVAEINEVALVIGCKSSIHFVEGDIGQSPITPITNDVGVLSRDSYCVDGHGGFVFTDGVDLYRWSAGEGLQNMTIQVHHRLFKEYDEPYNISMAWDSDENGVYIVQSRSDKSRGWFLDYRTMGLFPDIYGEIS